jgi:hypothetical protein
MYFTDKFPRSDLKLLHPGLTKQSPGRKPAEVHKNVTSDDFMFLSKVYSNSIFKNPQSPLTPYPANESIKEIARLQLEINQKSKDIQHMEYQLQQKINKDLLLSGIPNTYQNYQDSYKLYSKELQNQIKEHQMNRIKEKELRDKDILKRLEDLKALKDDEILKRKNFVDQAQEYKKLLENQSNLKRSIEYSQSSVFPALRNKNKKSYAPAEFERLEVPLNKNDNSLAVSMSNLSIFSQPRYTKNKPKIIRTSPILGDQLY